jgi:Relaxase/Mobilisation nuclease domain
MIVKISGSGKSFKGLSTYLTHDPNANTDERVAWTHTLNLANDHVPSAVDEMVWTARNAELLKQEAGVRAGGRSTENPVKHISLNWAPDDNPTREHMVGTSESFLKHMGWSEHQAVLIAHDDKSYKHVHIMLNVVHPETGLRLNDGFEQRRAQAWALEYEREQGRIHCDQRQKNAGDREENMPRNIWMAFQVNEKEFIRAEKIMSENASEIPENPKNAEWKILKEFQRDERIAFFAQGRAEFSALRNSIYREVREEFRERWADFYEMRKNGADAESLAEAKAQLVADQKAVLEPRRDEACQELRESRDIRYRELHDDQKEMRAELRWRQDVGLDATPFLNELEERRQAGQEIRTEFRETGRELVGRELVADFEASRHEETENDDAPVTSGRDVDINIGCRIGHGFVAFADALFTDLTNLGSARPIPMSAEERADQLREAAENTVKQQQQHEREEEDTRSRERRRAFGE